MKVVLIKKCLLGEVGDIVNVSDGYANNFLLKQGLAMKDTDKARMAVQVVAKKKQKKVRTKNDELKKALTRIKKDSVINIHIKANEQGHLYAAMSDANLIQALESQLGVVKGNLKIRLITVIKELGKINAEISINNKNKNLTVNIKQLDDSQTD